MTFQKNAGSPLEMGGNFRRGQEVHWGTVSQWSLVHFHLLYKDGQGLLNSTRIRAGFAAFWRGLDPVHQNVKVQKASQEGGVPNSFPGPVVTIS